MEAAQNLPPHLQQEFLKKIEQRQMKESLTMYTNLVERCFGSCVTSFKSKTLDKYETGCLENCASRYIKMTTRVGMRFQEQQAMQQKKAMEAAQMGG